MQSVVAELSRAHHGPTQAQGQGYALHPLSFSVSVQWMCHMSLITDHMTVTCSPACRCRAGAAQDAGRAEPTPGAHSPHGPRDPRCHYVASWQPASLQAANHWAHLAGGGCGQGILLFLSLFPPSPSTLTCTAPTAECYNSSFPLFRVVLPVDLYILAYICISTHKYYKIICLPVAFFSYTSSIPPSLSDSGECEGAEILCAGGGIFPGQGCHVVHYSEPGGLRCFPSRGGIHVSTHKFVCLKGKILVSSKTFRYWIRMYNLIDYSLCSDT